jgi:trehalose transport system permease protein
LNNSKLSRTGLYIVIFLVSLAVIYPLYVLFLIAFSPVRYTLDARYPLQYPGGLTLTNLLTAFKGFNLVGPALRSIETAFLVGAIALVIGIPAAYGLSKLPRRQANTITTLLFLVNMLPAIVIAIPISAQFISAHLYNTVPGLALAQELVVLPLSVFLLLGAFDSIPRDLEYQARVDGAGLLRTVYLILVPLAKAGVVSTFLLAWMMSWDEFTFAVILSPINPTLPIVIYENITRGNILASSAFALILTLPVVVMTMLLQRYLKGEFLAGGLNG